jgi:hypothetical protein
MTGFRRNSMSVPVTVLEPTLLDTGDLHPAFAKTAPTGAGFDPVRHVGAAQLVELILKDRHELHRILSSTRHKVELATRFLGISLAAFALFGVAMALTCDAAAIWPQLTPTARWLEDPTARLITFAPVARSGQLVESWLTGRAEKLVMAYAFGLVAASCVCLPSLYFYGLLSGIRMTFAEVVLHALKAKAVSAVALVGILPIYAALALGAIFWSPDGDLMRATLLLGLSVPFLAGLWGTRSLYVGFGELCGRMPKEFQENRACFLRRLVFAWCACYTAVAPVMIVTVWQHLGR